MRMFQTKLLPNGEKVRTLSPEYTWNGKEIRRRTPKVKGKAAKKTAKMQRIYDRAQAFAKIMGANREELKKCCEEHGNCMTKCVERNS